MNADRGNRKRLTNKLVDDEHPFWSPDAQQISFVSFKHVDAVFRHQIHLMAANGEHVARHGGGDDNPDWYNPSGRVFSPLGNRITIRGRFKSLVEQSFDSISYQVI